MTTTVQHSCSYKVTVVTELDELMRYENHWHALLESYDQKSVALSPEWFKCWWKAHSNHSRAELNAVLIFLRDTPVAIFPMQMQRASYRGVPIRKLSTCTDGITPHADFVIADRFKDTAIDLFSSFLCDCRRRWDVVVVDRLRDNFHRRHFLRCLRLHGLNYGQQASLKTPIIKATQPWDEFWSERSTKFRKTMRNKLNRVKRSNSVTTEIVESPVGVPDALAAMFRVSSASWKGKNRRGLADNPVELDFYRDFTALGMRNNWIRIWLLKQNDRAIAYEYHVVYRNVVYPLRADFDETYRSLSPGSVLEYTAIKHLFESGTANTYYSCADDYRYLLNWTDEIDELQRIDVFSNRPLSTLLFLVEFSVIPRLRKIPLLRTLRRLAAPAHAGLFARLW